MTRRSLLLIAAWLLLAGVSRCRSGHDAYPERLITVRGVLAGDEAECPTLRDRYGIVYALVGDTGGYKRGDRVCVKGWQVDASICGRGNTIRVQSIGLARWCP
jgi:hypothetical protein